MYSFDVEGLEKLSEISRKINSSYDHVDDLPAYILEAAMQIVRCEASSMLLVNPDGTLRFVVALGPKGVQAKSVPVSKNSIAGWAVTHREPLIINDVENDPRFFNGVKHKTRYAARTMIAVPLVVQNDCIGVIELINKAGGEPFDESDMQDMEMFCIHAGIAYKNAENYRVAQMSVAALQDALSSGGEFHTFIAKSPATLDLLKVIDEMAPKDIAALITGENGVGKELFAEQIHKRSGRAKKHFVRVNCAAHAPEVLEGELFGGAVTAGAKVGRKGCFETADGGTIFLEEIGGMPLALQEELLRVMQSKELRKPGSDKAIPVDVRVVASTSRDLEAMVGERTFSKDLHFRLNAVPIKVPPLRERKDDISAIADYFLKKFSSETKKGFTGFSRSALDALYSYRWPGNVRELKNSVERACILGTPPLVNALDLRLNNTLQSADGDALARVAAEYSVEVGGRSLKEAVGRFKKAYVMKVLEEVAWNKRKAAELLGIERTYVSRLIRTLHIGDE